MLPPNHRELRNGVLRATPEPEFQAIRSRLEWIPLPLGNTLALAGTTATHVFFIDSGLISLIAPLEHGDRMEIGHVGREGVAGVHALLGADTATAETLVQGEGYAYRAEVGFMRQAVEENRGLRAAIVRFSNALYVQVSQTAACNGTHDVVQRLARWLLMAHDRTDGDTLMLTHEMISLMLGVTRPGVTIAAGALQKAGIIQYARGKVTVIDRSGLEAAACECYRIVAAYYRSELG